MQLKQLRSFLALAKRGTFTRAAREVELSQPAVSQHVEELEREIGAPLVIRSRPTVELTDLGQELRRHAEHVFESLEEAHLAMREKRGTRHGVLRVGHTSSHRDAALAAAAAVMDGFPEVRIVLEELLAPRLEARLRSHHLDLGLRGYVGRLPPTKRRLAHEVLGRSPYPLVVNAEHPLAKATDTVALSALVSEPFALKRSRRPRPEGVDEFFKRERFKPKVAVEASAVVDILALVRAKSELVTIIAVPAPHLSDLHGLALVPLSDAPVQTSVLLWPAPELRSEAAKAFQTALRQCFRVGASRHPARPVRSARL